jgi:hypothetical protein
MASEKLLKGRVEKLSFCKKLPLDAILLIGVTKIYDHFVITVSWIRKFSECFACSRIKFAFPISNC